MEINIGHLYPDMLNLYSDGGNICALERRLKLRGIDAHIKNYKIDDEIDFENLDIVLLGGGSDREQNIVAKKMYEFKNDVKSYVENDGVLLALCSGYELLGNYIKINDEKINGIGILDIHTEYDKNRLIGNIILESKTLGTTIVGFENHAGRIYAGNYTPLGVVKCGYGNNEIDKKEGVIYKNVVASYVHGPLLPKNPVLTDYILKNAITKKYGDVKLPPLDDTLETNAHNYILNRFL